MGKHETSASSVVSPVISSLFRYIVISLSRLADTSDADGAACLDRANVYTHLLMQDLGIDSKHFSCPSIPNLPLSLLLIVLAYLLYV